MKEEDIIFMMKMEILYLKKYNELKPDWDMYKMEYEKELFEKHSKINGSRR
jgi:hypothetical protein